MYLNRVDSATLQMHFNDSTEALESLSLWNGKTQLTPEKIHANPTPARVIEVHELSSAVFAKHVPTRLVSKICAFVFSPSCVFPFHRGLPCRRVTGASITHVPCCRVTGASIIHVCSAQPKRSRSTPSSRSSSPRSLCCREITE